MIINIDIDNCCNDFIQKFIYYLNGVQTETCFSLDDFIDYSLSRSTGFYNGYLETLFFRNNNFYEQLRPLVNCVETIKELVTCDNEVRFVTAIRYDVVQARLDFIKEYFPFIDPDKQLIVTNNKESIYADIVIEDCTDNLKNVNKDCDYILFDQPWNKDFEIRKEDRIHRAFDWYSVHHELRELGAFRKD